MIASTLGFLFTPDFKKVLLIRKQKPVHHKGLLNGLGGKTEAGETEVECIVREVEEESGLHVPEKDWKEIGSLQWTEWDVAVFTGVYSRKANKVKSDDDDVQWYDANDLPINVVTNLRWLIPLCLDILQTKQDIFVETTYR